VDTGGVNSIPQNVYHELDRVPEIPTTANDPADYGTPFADPGTGDGVTTAYWFTQSFSVPGVPASNSLMTVLQSVGSDAGSYITFSTGDLSANFLSGLNFGVDLEDHPNRFGPDSGIYNYDPDTGEGYWEGWAWMYFIGTPQAPVDGQSSPDSSGLPNTTYPDMGLGDYTVGRLNGYGGGFTLSYEKTSITFSAMTSTENGELVHKISVKHKKQ
jgi:hypothetical protein